MLNTYLYIYMCVCVCILKFLHSLADINLDSTATNHRYFLKFLLEKSLSQLVKVVTWPLSNSILDLLTTTNSNLVNKIETHTVISDHLIVTFDICMKTKYQTKKPSKLFNFQKADTNNLKSKALNFTQEFLNSNPIKNLVDTNWEFIQHNLCTIVDTTVPWILSHGKRHLPWISIGSSEEEINSTVEQGNTRMLQLGSFLSV